MEWIYPSAQQWRTKAQNGQLDTHVGFYENGGPGDDVALSYLNNMNRSGYTWKGMDGKDVGVSGNTIDFLQQAVGPWIDKSYANEEAKKSAITANVENMIKAQGNWAMLNGNRKWNDDVQTGLNNLIMRAEYLLASKNPEERQEGQNLMRIATRGQYVFNMAQPQVTQAMQARIKPYKDFLGNNWWWMIPGGLLALGGIASLFGGRNDEQQLEQAGWPFAHNAPQQLKQPLPEGWTSPLVPKQPIANTGLV